MCGNNKAEEVKGIKDEIIEEMHYFQFKFNRIFH
jgi:hypothetical protein